MKLRILVVLALSALLVSAAKKTMTSSSGTDTAVASTSDPVMIFEVSSSPAYNNYMLYGSLEGGMVLYISGMGFDPSSSNNQVTFGSYPCIIPNGGATETVISCMTTKAYNPGNASYLTVTVSVSGKQSASCTSWNCCFSYYTYYTPEINQLLPKSGFPGDIIQFFGIHKAYNASNITSLKIGDSVCSTYNLTNISD